WSEAAEVFQSVVARDADRAEAHAGFGIGLQGLGRSEEAEAALRRSIGLAFHNPLAHFHLGQVLAARGALEDAARSLRTAMAQQPGFTEAKPILDNVEHALAAAIVDRARAAAKPA